MKQGTRKSIWGWFRKIWYFCGVHSGTILTEDAERPLQPGHSVCSLTTKLPGTELKARQFTSELIENQDFSFCQFYDLYCKAITFRNCTFKHSTFTRCYFRKAKFELCNFTGACFLDCNLREARLNSCELAYTSYRATHLEKEEFFANLPQRENEMWLVARALRTNAHSVGDSEGVNYFINVEMEATRTHWCKKSFSSEPYYKNKYGGFWGRLKAQRTYCYYLFDFLVWGHGERPLHVLWTILFILIAASVLVISGGGNSELVLSPMKVFWTFQNVSLLFLGITPSDDFTAGKWVHAALAMSRFVSIALLIAVLIKRMSRR